MNLPENRIPQFRFFPVALSAQRGALHLAPPLNEEGDWWVGPERYAGGIEVPCTDLLSLMSQNEHARIDLLKLDIEASEYAVIDDLIKRRIPVRQICLEFHHGVLPGIRRGQTIRAILKLILNGYQLINQDMNNHTFIKGRTSLG